MPGDVKVEDEILVYLTKRVLCAPSAPRHTSWASAAAAFTPIESLKPVPKAKLTLFRPETVALGFLHCANAAVDVSARKKIVARASNCFFIGLLWVKKREVYLIS